MNRDAHSPAAMIRTLVSGPLDALSSRQVRFIEEAARHGPVEILLWSDESISRLEGRPPRFPESERLYFYQALRYVHSVEVIHQSDSPHVLPASAIQTAGQWALLESDDHPLKRAFCQNSGLNCLVIPEASLAGFPVSETNAPAVPGHRRVIVTGSFDWLHTGHVRFFEEVSGYGDLTVVVGHDDNIQLLKGPGHPLFPQAERLYLVQSIRYVRQALLSTGHGWLDAEPEIARLRPDIYAVNEDGDKPEKRAYCQANGIEYLVLTRVPRTGLPRRSSTDLRGF